MKKCKKIFISGMVTDNENYKEDFELAEKHLYEMFPNAKIVNPTKYNLEECTWDEAMEITLKLLDECDTICLLASWLRSKGSKEELLKALEKGLNIIDQQVGEDLVGYNFSDKLE